MSGENELRPSSWTVDSLKEFVLDKIAEQDRRYQQRFEAQEKALNRALIAQNRRLDSMNEFRATLSDQSNTFLPRPEYDTAHQALIDKIDALTIRITTSEGQAQGATRNVGKIYATIGAVGTLLAIITLLANSVF